MILNERPLSSSLDNLVAMFLRVSYQKQQLDLIIFVMDVVLNADILGITKYNYLMVRQDGETFEV